MLIKSRPGPTTGNQEKLNNDSLKIRDMSVFSLVQFKDGSLYTIVYRLYLKRKSWSKIVSSSVFLLLFLVFGTWLESSPFHFLSPSG